MCIRDRLATVTVFAVRGITDKGKTNACAADKKTLEVAVEAYVANGGSFPLLEASLVPDFLVSEVKGYDLTQVPAVAGVSPATVTIGPAPAAQNTNGCA